MYIKKNEKINDLNINILYILLTTMEFCKNCNNLLYYDSSNNILENICKVCGFTAQSKNYILEKIEYKNNNISNIFDSTFIYDNTLPRTTLIKCPNTQCNSHVNITLQEAIIKKIKNKLDNYYMCVVCKSSWKS